MEALVSLIRTMFIASLVTAGVCVYCYIRFPKFQELIRSLLWSVFICGISLILALIYLVSPIDLVPDPIPVIGQLDDLGVVAAAMLTIPVRLIYTMKLLLYGKRNGSA